MGSNIRIIGEPIMLSQGETYLKELHKDRKELPIQCVPPRGYGRRTHLLCKSAGEIIILHLENKYMSVVGMFHPAAPLYLFL